MPNSARCASQVAASASLRAFAGPRAQVSNCSKRVSICCMIGVSGMPYFSTDVPVMLSRFAGKVCDLAA